MNSETERLPSKRASVAAVAKASRHCELCGKPLLVKDTRQERNTWSPTPSYICRWCILERDAQRTKETRERLGLRL